MIKEWSRLKVELSSDRTDQLSTSHCGTAFPRADGRCGKRSRVQTPYHHGNHECVGGRRKRCVLAVQGVRAPSAQHCMDQSLDG